MATVKKRKGSVVIVPALEDPTSRAYIEKMGKLYGKGDPPIEKVQKALDEALGEKLLSQMVIESRG